MTDDTITLSGDDARFIANLLARFGILLDFTLELPEGDGVMFRIEPRETARAHGILLDALHPPDLTERGHVV